MLLSRNVKLPAVVNPRLYTVGRRGTFTFRLLAVIELETAIYFSRTVTFLKRPVLLQSISLELVLVYGTRTRARSESSLRHLHGLIKELGVGIHCTHCNSMFNWSA